MKYIYPLAIIAFLVSCNDSISDKAYIIESETTLSFDIKKDVNIASRCYRHIETEDEEYIALATNHYNKDIDEIVFFRITDTTESHRIPVYKRGENSVGCELSGFDIIDLDTIVVANNYRPSFYFINSNGEIINSHIIGNEHCTAFPLRSLNNKPWHCLNDTIIEFPQTVPYTRSPMVPNPPNFKFSECPLAYLINKKTGEAIASEIGFPCLYPNDDNINHGEGYSRIFDGENFVYGFLAYDSLIVTSDHKTAKTYCAKSRYIGDVKNPGTPPGTAIPDIMRKLSTLASYGNLIYDPFHEVYYRFCYFENDYPGPYTLEYTISGGAFTIMIIDKEFNVIGETVFPDKRYASKIFFVNKDGLWLSENHFLREDMTDDKLVFRCLKLEYF